MIGEAVINEFVAECREHLNATERDLLAMENGHGAADPDTVNRVFRAMHSIKGASGTFGFNAVMGLSHAMENVLLLFRQGRIVPDGDMVHALLKGVDRLRGMIEDLEASEGVACEDELRRLNAILQGAGSAKAESPPPQASVELSLGVLEIPERVIKPEIRPAAPEEPAPPVPSPATDGRKAPAETIRVNVALLDSLMNLAGELVLGRNQLRRFVDDSVENPLLNRVVQNMDLVTGEIQEKIMQMRMQPLANVFNRLHRLVRDLSRQLGKDVELTVSGGEVELDKSIIEGISDPLTHILRNGVDHGIESAWERAGAGKAPRGGINLRAFHEKGQVNITISDDGQGIDPDKVAASAVAMGHISEEEAGRLSDRERLNLVFLPGFSTAEAVTGVSGRGVGMDVVKTNIEKLGGHIEIDSTVGAGTTIRLMLPLTLAIVPSLIVRVADQRFAIPQINVQELVCIPPEDVSLRIEKVGEASVLRLRENLLPLVRLADILGLERFFIHPATRVEVPDRRRSLADRRSPREETAAEQRRGRRYRRQGDIFVVVVRMGENRFGLIVDELFDIEEIVVKPLSNHIRNCPCFSGATIMGDGRVAMILDALGIADFARLRFSEISAEERRRQRESGRGSAPKTTRRSVLIFNHGEGEYFAVPLASVARLEMIAPSALERIGGREFMSYRGGGLPLVRLDRLLPVSPLPERMDETYVVIPKTGGGRRAGIIASRILDAIDTDVVPEKDSGAAFGVLGSAVIDGHITIFLDLDEVLEGFESEASSFARTRLSAQ
ncbi:MAG: chemotaxis protein CheA [Acidobacteriota bacterium]